MKSNLKPGTYTATPASLVMPMSPYPTETKPPLDREVPLHFREASTPPTSIDEADDRTQDLLSDCKRRFRNNDPTGIATLLEEYPLLIYDPWVRENLYKLVKSGRYRRSRGRPRGTFTVHPLLMVGLVEAAIQRKDAANPEQAFKLLEGCGWCLYETAKMLYFQAKNEPRFKSILIAQTDKTRPAPEEEIARVATAETLKPGNPITRRFSHPVLGSGQVTLSATGDTDNT